MLPNVLHSLVCVIVNYHDAQSVTERLTSNDTNEALHEKASELLKLPTDTLIKELSQRIDLCTRHWIIRKPFLDFILDHISYFKTVVETPSPYNDEQLAAIKERLLKLTTDLCGLLNTSKTTNYKVTLNDVQIDIKGLVNWRTTCRSGEIIRDHVLNKLSLDKTSSPDVIQTTVNKICIKFNNQLKIQHYDTLLRENAALSQTHDHLVDEHSELQKACEALRSENLSLKQVHQNEAEPQTLELNNSRNALQDKDANKSDDNSKSRASNSTEPKSSYNSFFAPRPFSSYSGLVFSPPSITAHARRMAFGSLD